MRPAGQNRPMPTLAFRAMTAIMKVRGCFRDKEGEGNTNSSNGGRSVQSEAGTGEAPNLREAVMSAKHARKKAHGHRDDLTGEHAAGDAGQIILACLFAVVWIADTFLLKVTTFLNPYIPLAVKVSMGAVLLVLSAYLVIKSHSIVFGQVREEPAVIRGSVFDIVRHPMYLSEILLYLGLLMLSLSLAAAVVWIIAIGFLHTISRHEERLLLARFGEDYEKYMREVPMWFPRLLKR